MPGLSAPMFGVAATSILLFAVGVAGSPDVYSKLQVNMVCRDFHIPDVTARDACFGDAANSVGLGGKLKLHLNHMGFTGCVFNTVANAIMFGASTGITSENTPAFRSWQYLCNGVPTTTTSATRTTTVTTTTVSTATSRTKTTTTALYAKLEGGVRCSEYKIPDVDSKEACFGTAMSAVGLHGVPTFQLDYLGFSGCLHNTVANIVMYGVTPGVPRERNQALSVWQFICNGIPTTTTTTTAAITTTSTTQKQYVKLDGGLRCVDQQLQAVLSKEECFAARALIGSVAGTINLDGLGFTGCIFNSAANMLLYGVTPGTTPETTMTMPVWQYICEASPRVMFP
jgi:hypothetical protein